MSASDRVAFHGERKGLFARRTSEGNFINFARGIPSRVSRTRTWP